VPEQLPQQSYILIHLHEGYIAGAEIWQKPYNSVTLRPYNGKRIKPA